MSRPLHRIHVLGTSLLLALVLVAPGLLVAGVSSAPKSRLVAVYGEAIARKEIPPGWSFAWNAYGALGKPSALAPLVDVEISSGPKRVQLVRGVAAADGTLLPGTPSINQFATILGGRNSDGTASYAVATYVMQEDAAGEVCARPLASVCPPCGPVPAIPSACPLRSLPKL